MLRQAEPKLSHGKPMRLRFKHGRTLRKLEAALRPYPEFLGKFHVFSHPVTCMYKGRPVHSFPNRYGRETTRPGSERTHFRAGL